MKRIPQYIESALRRREKAALAWLEADSIITKYIIRNDLSDKIDSYDFGTGTEALINPHDSNNRIRDAINAKLAGSEKT